MMPKISVRPAASMNSSRPYCTLFRSWIRKFAMSMVSAAAGKQQQSAHQSEQATANSVAPADRSAGTQHRQQPRHAERAQREHGEFESDEGQGQHGELRN